MSTAKDEVRKILKALPESVILEDIQYHIFVQEKVKRSLKDVRAGKLLSQKRERTKNVQMDWKVS